MATDLVFTGSPLTTPPIGLIFNESDAPSLDRQVEGAGSFAPLSGSAPFTLHVFAAGTGSFAPLTGEGYLGAGNISAAGEGSFAPLQGTGSVLYNTDTQRPLVATVRDSFQNGLDVSVGLTQRMQGGVRMRVTTEVKYQEALRARQAFEERWQDAARLRNALEGRYQMGLPVRSGFDDGFADATPARRAVADRYQQGVKVRGSFVGRFQDTLRRRNWTAARYQEAARYFSGSVVSRAQKAKRSGLVLDIRYQDAIRPGAGKWARPPVPPSDPCYVPNPNLVFVAPWSADTALVFVCEAHDPGPEPEAVVVVPVRRVYVVLNTATLYRVNGAVLLPTFGMSMSLDVDSWTWSFSASLPGAALPDLEPDGDGTPVLVEATVNGVAYRFFVEKIARERAFAQDGIRIDGRGMAAELAAPIAPILNFDNAGGLSAQQLMGEVLSLNGVPLPDWTVDWQMEDWLVPAGAWTKQGTYIEALNEIVGAAGGYLQPTPATKSLKALLRYPVLPWDWVGLTPDYELPSAAITRESIDWVEKPRYDRVFVSGQSMGVLGNVKRTATAGEIVAPMVTDSLITHATAARQRGGSILANTGRIASYALRMPAGVKDTDDISVGIIPPGKFVRYADNGVMKLGITRSVSVDIGSPDIFQTIGIEVHESV